MQAKTSNGEGINNQKWSQKDVFLIQCPKVWTEVCYDIMAPRLYLASSSPSTW